MADSRGRRVRFHGRVQFKTIRHVSDFSEKEIGAGWYRKKDFVRMSEDVSEIATMVSQGEEQRDGEILCIRGLEHLVEEDVADYRAEKMIASIDAVLDEQDEQRDEDVYDPDIIAQIYVEIVTPLLREAYLVGLRDAQEAAEAAEQIPDLKQEELPPLETKKAKSVKTAFDNANAKVGTELLSNDQSDAGKTKAKGPPKKAKRIDRGKASESSPLVRRRDGSFAFRRKDAELEKARMKQQRRDCVRESLFKFLDDDDVDLFP